MCARTLCWRWSVFWSPSKTLPLHFHPFHNSVVFSWLRDETISWNFTADNLKAAPMIFHCTRLQQGTICKHVMVKIKTKNRQGYWKSALAHPNCQHRIYPNKRRGVYLTFHALANAALLRGWRLFQGSIYLNVERDKRIVLITVLLFSVL